MFDLEQSISQWRTAHSSQGAANTDALNELESHMRDEISALLTRELSAEEAFLVTVLRMGAPQDVAAEFAKVDCRVVWMNRLKWMLAGYLLTNLGSLTFTFSTRLLEVLASDVGISTGATALIACYGPIALFAIVGIAIFKSRLMAQLRRVAERSRRYFSVASIVFGCCAAILMMNCVSFMCEVTIFSPPSRNVHLWQFTAYRNSLITVLGPMAAVVLLFSLRQSHREKAVAPGGVE
ncbi:MAG TPA: permease prefix domain 1-containing protein [Pirellulales bacterium]|jgi:hypothetical protein